MLNIGPEEVDAEGAKYVRTDLSNNIFLQVTLSNKICPNYVVAEW